MFKSVANLVTSIVLLGCVVIGAAILMGRGVPKKDGQTAHAQQPVPAQPQAETSEENPISEFVTNKILEGADMAKKAATDKARQLLAKGDKPS